jgi:nicotinate-nucleotide adenylyltransferase
MTATIAVYGGSFSPFGSHHLDVVRHLGRHELADRVIVVPSAAHALKGRTFPFEHRLNMARLALQETGLILPTEASSVEMHMLQRQAGPIFTIQLLRHLQQTHPDAQLRFVIGPDIIAELDRWKYVDDIRRDFGFIQAPDMGIHSSSIREMLVQGVPAWERHVPQPVADYVRMHGLYHVGRTSCDHEWENTIMQTFDHPHEERCAKCSLPRPGSETAAVKGTHP